MKTAEPPRRFGFVMEQTLGHVTHYRNLRAALEPIAAIETAWFPLAFAPRGTLETLPPLRTNWSARASLRSLRLLRRAHAEDRFDAVFFHTQVTALLSAHLLRRVPGVLSLDATPINYDRVGAAYGHGQSVGAVEHLKFVANRRAFHAAAALITWCAWARHSLIEDYGVDAARIMVIAPGVDLAQWPAAPHSRASAGTQPFRLLFVGADFARKGGEVLLRAFQMLPDYLELHLVTKAPVAPAPRVHVYPNLAPNSTVLRGLYAQADVFVLPTLADCFPLVVQEALAAGLPVVATAVGAIGEAVLDGVTGLLVPPGDARALAGAVYTLAQDPALRASMGAAGRRMAEERFDSAANARRIVEVLTHVSAPGGA
jgi:glycosyltransferase involved in cell wall biosynthesis